VTVPPGPDERDVYRFVADDSTAVDLSADYLRVSLRQPRVWISWGLIVVLVTIFGITQHQIVTAIAVAVLTLALIVWQLRRNVVRALKSSMPPGSVHTCRYSEESMASTGPLGYSEVRFSAFSSIWIGRRAVVLRQHGTRVVQILPVELMPPDKVALVRAGLRPRKG